MQPQYQGLDSVTLKENDQIFIKSTAVLRILFQLGGHWNALAVFLSAIPRPVRDFGYTIFARNRYRIFGQNETCRLPSAAEKSRFIE